MSRLEAKRAAKKRQHRIEMMKLAAQILAHLAIDIWLVHRLRERGRG